MINKEKEQAIQNMSSQFNSKVAHMSQSNKEEAKMIKSNYENHIKNMQVNYDQEK